MSAPTRLDCDITLTTQEQLRHLKQHTGSHTETVHRAIDLYALLTPHLDTGATLTRTDGTPLT
ncbi:hypothetical protein [Streptomyces griseofuscus]|uniref:hypothetical protein n=1 Tax=Streptomyces griseofuscus TaxID=146922 RepID=UPI0036BA147A